MLSEAGGSSAAMIQWWWCGLEAKQRELGFGMGTTRFGRLAFMRWGGVGCTARREDVAAADFLGGGV